MKFYDEKEQDWLKTKWGVFSASEAYKLMIPGTDEMFSKGGHTYIKRIAREACSIYNDEEKGFTTLAMRNGNLREPVSFIHLYKLLGFKGLRYIGGSDPEFKHFNADVGCSPDVLAPLPDGRISFGCELKNPKADTHFDYLIDDKKCIRDWMDLKAKKLNYYTQVQLSMMCYNCDLWLWASYNEYMKEFDDQMLIIEVPKDIKFCNELEVRLKMAVKKKYEWVVKLKNRNLAA